MRAVSLLSGTIVLELSKEKHNASLLDRQLNQFQTSINRIESELSSQIRYLTQVSLSIPMFLETHVFTIVLFQSRIQ